MKNKIVTLFLCLCMGMTMTACAGNDTENAETKEEVITQSESALSVDNGTLASDSVAVSVGKTTVLYEEYKLYDYFMRNQYETVLGKEVWNYAVDSDGRTIGQDAIEDVLRLIIQVKIINKAAESQDVVLAADEKEEAENSASKYCDSLSDEEKNENGITASLVSRIFAENKLAEKMYNIIIGKVDVKLSDSECEAARVQLVYLKADDTNREEVRQKMTELQAEAKKASSFYSFARENTEADEVEYLIGRQDSRSHLMEAVLGMKQYGISNVIEEDDGFYIAYCVSENSKSIRKEYKNQVVEERQNEAFIKVYKEWADCYEVKVSKSLLVEG